ncbi:hypothetical protein Droror1_Dr00019850, partial [Drosera rotundifolia]
LPVKPTAGPVFGLSLGWYPAAGGPRERWWPDLWLDSLLIGLDRGGSWWWCEMHRCVMLGLASLGICTPWKGDEMRRLGGRTRRLAELEGDGGVRRGAEGFGGN